MFNPFSSLLPNITPSVQHGFSKFTCSYSFSFQYLTTFSGIFDDFLPISVSTSERINTSLILSNFFFQNQAQVRVGQIITDTIHHVIYFIWVFGKVSKEACFYTRQIPTKQLVSSYSLTQQIIIFKHLWLLRDFPVPQVQRWNTDCRIRKFNLEIASFSSFHPVHERHSPRYHIHCIYVA